MGGDHPFHQIACRLIHDPARRIGVVPGDDLLGACREGDGCRKAGDEALDLGVVKDDAVRLVAEQAGSHLGIECSDHVRRHVHDVRLDACGVRQGCIDLIPRQHLVGGDVERLSDGLPAAQEPNEPPCKVRVVRQDPEGGSIAMDHDLLPFAHAVEIGVVAEEGDLGPVVGVRGPHDRPGEAALAVGPHQPLFALDLAARIRPEGVAQRRRLADGQAGDGLLVHGGRADEDILLRAISE